jgi:hypothetical protein
VRGGLTYEVAPSRPTRAQGRMTCVDEASFFGKAFLLE